MPILRISEARRMKGISQTEMAMLLGCSITAYRNKEKYRTTMNANEIADFLINTGLDYEQIIFCSPICVIKKTQQKERK